MDADQERQKWDSYYASISNMDEAENILNFRQEVVDCISNLLPDGGRILEAGCGAGEQSLALARNPKFDLTLLDFSSPALDHARRAFAHTNLTPEFILGDVFTQGEPNHDLVFNAGVLEHYRHDQQVALLRGMASRSRKYVLVFVPNIQNYWYWIWRTQKSSQGLWPFGKEIPSFDLASIFQKAGLHFHGSIYLGKTWTEDFITGIDGISDSLKDLFIKTHQSSLLPDAQTHYLLAVLGSVIAMPGPVCWDGFDLSESHYSAEKFESLTASLADSLALQIAAEHDTVALRDVFLAKLSALSVQLGADTQQRKQEQMAVVDTITHQHAAALAQKNGEIQILMAQITALTHQHAVESTQKNGEIQTLMAQIAALIHQHAVESTQKNGEIQTLIAQIATLTQPKPTFLQRVKSLINQKYWILREHPRLQWLKRIYKRLRHLFQVRVAEIEQHPKAIYVPPIKLGHQKISPNRRVTILTYTFFDFDGNNMYYGGAERYLLELAVVIRSLGYIPEIVQCGNGYWVRYYQDLRVTGIDVVGDAMRLADQFSKLDHHESLIIHSPFSLASFQDLTPAIGIGHGIYWDHPSFQVDAHAAQKVLETLKNLAVIISVDTNTINWMRATSSDLAEKFTYIPNFVDAEAFSSHGASNPEKLVILYPRRLYRPRGFWLIADLVPQLLSRYPQVEFYFVGKADLPEEEHVKILMAQYPGRIRWDSLSPEEMPKAYRQANITIIPTVHSEGTSLSCLEALASGNAVIASNVGGLPNLIIHEHNGLLIAPKADALMQALTRLIEDQDLREQLGDRGRDVASTFSLARWRTQWQEILVQYLDDVVDEDISAPQVAVFPMAPGITWEGIKQRPHHLALQLAQAGIETFWQNPSGRQPSPHPLLHITGPDDEFCGRSPIIIIYYPYTFEDLSRYQQPYVVYDILDDISIHQASDRERNIPKGSRAVDFHQKLLSEADLVITSSTVLFERLKSARADIVLVPNGVDLDHFSKINAASSANSKPIIGFHGAIAEWFDVELLYQVAKIRPGFHFELVGPASIAIESLMSLKNVDYLGVVAYENIPEKITQFDVGILPFTLSEMTHAVRPLKVLEYLAMGVPVVATPLQEIQNWPGVLTADTPEAFAQKLDIALETADKWDQDQDFQDLVAASSWEQVVIPLLERLP